MDLFYTYLKIFNKGILSNFFHFQAQTSAIFFDHAHFSRPILVFSSHALSTPWFINIGTVQNTDLSADTNVLGNFLLYDRQPLEP